MWQRFHVWRRSRPFWGGLLTLLAGLEIFGSMNLEINGGTIAIGQEGFASYLVVMVLVLCGFLAWFTPLQRHFYGLLAALVAIYSLIGVNLGGFFAGMLLGVAGGGLIFAWSPEEETAPEGEIPSDTDTDEVPSIFLREGVPSEQEEQEQGPKASSPRHAAMMIMVVALSVSMLAVMGAQTRAEAAGPCGQPSGPASPIPSTNPSPSAAATSGGGSGGIIGQIVDFFGRLLGGGSSNAQPAASATPSTKPSTKPSPATSPTPAPCPTKTTRPPGGPASPSKPATPKAKVLAAAPDQVPVARRPSRMTGSRVSMTNLNFDGNVDMPTTDGSLRVLKFTMASSDTNDFLLHVFDYSDDKNAYYTDLRSTKLTVRGGGVQFFTTRFRGLLFGLIPVDYTPDNPPPPIPLPFVFFTEPNIELVWVDSPALDAPNLQITQVVVNT